MSYYDECAYPKHARGKPAVVLRQDRRTSKATDEKQAKAAVMARDQKTCRCCGKPATEVHEVLAKSLGGSASLANSVALDKQCHALIHAAQISVEGTNCSKPLTFRMSQDIARRVFGRKARPAHVTVTP